VTLGKSCFLSRCWFLVSLEQRVMSFLLNCSLSFFFLTFVSYSVCNVTLKTALNVSYFKLQGRSFQRNEGSLGPQVFYG